MGNRVAPAVESSASPGGSAFDAQWFRLGQARTGMQLGHMARAAIGSLGSRKLRWPALCLRISDISCGRDERLQSREGGFLEKARQESQHVCALVNPSPGS